jgi:hypothetical protein
MKNNYVNAISVKTIFRNVFFVSFFTVLTVMGANAQKVADTVNSIASVTYLGSANEQMSFGLKYENETGEKYVITILDSEGVTLFDGSFSEKNFNKTFKVPVEIGNLTFIISNYKNRAEKKFSVTTERRLVEEVYVTKSK